MEFLLGIPVHKAAELKHGKLPQLEARLADAEANQSESSLVKEEVSQEEIADIISRWTGIPVTRLIEGEKQKLLQLESIMHESVIGWSPSPSAIAWPAP